MTDDRRTCSHRPPCPGCPRFGLHGIDTGARSALEALARLHDAQLLPVVEGDAFGYRVRSRLAVRGRTGSPKIGIFQAGSHRIADIPSCPVHHPRINEAASAVREAVRDAGIRPYADVPHRGLLRYIGLVVERGSATVQVTTVWNADGPEPFAVELDAFAGALSERLDGDLHSLCWNFNPARTNSILGPRFEHVSGPEAVHERIGGADVYFPPGAFGQANLDAADRIVSAVQAEAEGAARVVDLYAGVGPFGLGLLARGADVIFNEVAPRSLAGLARGLTALGQDPRERIAAGVADGALADGADVVIADPPRRGLEQPVARRLAVAEADRVVYVSCDAEALARDAAILVGGGGLRLRSLAPFALFPNTDHTETVAVFDRPGA